MKILNWKNGTYSFVWENIPFVMAGDDLLLNCITHIRENKSRDYIFNRLFKDKPEEKEFKEYIEQVEEALNFTDNYQDEESNSMVNKQSMFTLNLTRQCNLNCKHCYAGGTIKKAEMSIKQIEDLIDFMSTRVIEPKLMIITGGEPTIEQEKLKTAIKKGYQYGFKIRVNSNGILITNEMAKFFKEYNVIVQLSLDGIDAQTHALLRNDINAYGYVMNAINILKSNCVDFAISFTIHSENIKQLPQMIDFALKIGAEKFNTSSLVQIGNAKINNLRTVDFLEEFSSLYNEVRNDKRKQHLTRATLFAETVIAIRDGVKFVQCGTGNCTTCIDSSGEIYPCLNMMNSDFLISNVNDSNFKEQFNESKIREYLSKINISNLNDKCSKCFFKYWCGGYCRGETIANGGNITDPYVRCSSWKRGLVFILKCLAETPDLYEGEMLYE